MPDPNTPAQVRAGRYLYLVAGIAALGGLIFGYDTAVIAGAILYIKDEFALSANLREFVIASSLLGGMLGAAAGGKLADRWGRRAIFLVLAGLGLVGPLTAALAPTLTWLILGRVISGAAFGLATIAAPLYIAEVAPHESRGRLISGYTLAVMIGVLVSYLVDYALGFHHEWRLMLAMGAIPAVMLGIGTLFLPESPRWLVLKGRHDHARQELSRLRQSREVVVEWQALIDGLHQAQGSWRDLTGIFRIVLIIGIVLVIMRQATGISIAIFYAPTIFASAGFQSTQIDILATVAVGVMLVLATLVAIYLVDHWGRRVLLLTGLLGMMASMALLGLAFTDALAAWRGWLAVSGLMIFVVAWIIGPGTVTFILIAEIFPTFVRGLALSLVIATLWGAYLVDTLTFLNMLNLLGERGIFWFNSLISLLACWFVYRWVPETKGCSLEMIEAHWRQGKHPLDMKKCS